MAREPSVSPARRTVALGSSNRDRALDRGVDSSVAALEASLAGGTKPSSRPEYKILMIDELKPDPHNPRWGGDPPLTWEELLNPAAVDDLVKKEVIDSILELKQQMGNEGTGGGQQEPVKVFRANGFYQIITGERRYWSLRLAGKDHIDAMVYSQRPSHIRLMQYRENFDHLPPRFREQLFNLRQILDEQVELGTPIKDGAEFVECLGMGRATGYRWWSILNGPEDVIGAIRARRVESLKIAAQIVQEKDPAQRAVMLADPKRWFAGEGDSLSSAAISSGDEAARPPSGTRSRGRPGQHVSFGRTKNLGFAKFIILKLNTQAKRIDVDWSDPRAVTQLFKQTLEQLEKRFSKR